MWSSAGTRTAALNRMSAMERYSPQARAYLVNSFHQFFWLAPVLILVVPAAWRHIRPGGGNCRSGLNRALFWMRALRATALAIDEFPDDLALSGAPARDNLLAALGTNPYFIGTRFEHEGSWEGRVQGERELATVALHSTSAMIRITQLGTSTPMKTTMVVGGSIAQSFITRSSLHASPASHLVRSRANAALLSCQTSSRKRVSMGIRISSGCRLL
jgi:hypothetical protein